MRTNRRFEGGGTCDLCLEGWGFGLVESILSGCRKIWRWDIIGKAVGMLISLERMKGIELEQRYQVSEDIDLWLPFNKHQIYCDTILFECLEICNEPDCWLMLFFLFLIVGYLAQLPRGIHLTQDSMKIVGSPNFPGINK